MVDCSESCAKRRESAHAVDGVSGFLIKRDVVALLGSEGRELSARAEVELPFSGMCGSRSGLSDGEKRLRIEKMSRFSSVVSDPRVSMVGPRCRLDWAISSIHGGVRGNI